MKLAHKPTIDTKRAVVNVEITLPELARLAAKHGYAVVPEEPTAAMLKTAFAEMNNTPSGTWKRMKAAGETPRRMFDVKMVPRYRAMIQAGRINPSDDV